jgi:nitroreductase
MMHKTAMEKSSEVEYPISDLIRRRKSVRAFSPAPVESEKIKSLFEATRWAPSSTNEQPWLYIYATKDQQVYWEKMLEPLNESNKIWAKDAPLLILSAARKNFTRYGIANAHALYDLGAANAFLSLQAVELGLQVRQMAGFDAQKAAENMSVPDTFEIGVIMAVGYPGDPTLLPEKLRARENAPRERYPQQVFVMNGFFNYGK